MSLRAPHLAAAAISNLNIGCKQLHKDSCLRFNLRSAAATNGNSAPAAVHVAEQQLQAEESNKAVKKHPFQYPDGPSEATFFQLDNVEQLSSALAEYVVHASNEAIKHRGKFTFVLSGGSVVKTLRQLTEGPCFHSVVWEKWHVFWVDERMVPHTHEDSNYKLAKDEFLSKVPIPQDQIHTIQKPGDETAAAHAYESKLRELVRKKVIPTSASRKFPCFDFILLGVGRDGHIASLFPNRSSLAEDKRWVLPVSGSPSRITMTLPCINAAENVAFVALGEEKAHVVQRVLERPALPGALPAQMVRLEHGNLIWFTDKDAAAQLSPQEWCNAKRFPFFDFAAFKQPASTA